MTQVSLYSGLGDHVVKWATLVPGSATTYGGPLRLHEPQFKAELEAQHRALFEQLLLFDTVQMNIMGPNTIAPLLYNSMGAKSFERLLEQGALSFVIWQPVPHFSSDNGLVKAVFVARIGDGKDYEIDPERIVDYGLALCENNMSSSYKRMIRKKLIRIHSILGEEVSNSSWEFSTRALRSGLFEDEGLSSDLEILDAPIEQGSKFLKVTNSLLRYKYLLKNGYSSLEDAEVFNLFDNGLNNINSSASILKMFSTIAEYEKFPDLQFLYSQIEDPYDRLSRFRQSYTARRFRSWISGSSSENTDIENIREYIDACSKRKGLFESNSAKLIKIVTMVAIGQSVSLGLSESIPLGTILSSIPLPVVDKAIEAGVELCVGVTDSFIVDNLKTGWTPRAYLSRLRKMRK